MGRRIEQRQSTPKPTVRIEDVWEKAGREDRQKFIAKIGVNPSDPAFDEEDYLQEAALNTLRRRATIKDTGNGGNPKSVFITDAHFRGLDAERKAQARRKLGVESLEQIAENTPGGLGALQVPEKGPDICARLLNADFQRLYAQALQEAQLTPQDIAIFNETYEEGLSSLELATKYGLLPGTVRSRLFHIKQKLRATPAMQQALEEYSG